MNKDQSLLLQKNIPLDNEGYLLNLEAWSKDIACELANKDNITLTSDHWEVIEVVREFYQTYEISPSMRPLVKAMKTAYGTEKGKSIHLMKLFSQSPPKQAAKYAGLPKPLNCL